MSGVICQVSHVFFFFFFLDKVVGVVVGGYVINGAYPVSFLHILSFENEVTINPSGHHPNALRCWIRAPGGRLASLWGEPRLGCTK